MDDQEEMDDGDRHRNYEEPYYPTNDHDEQAEDNPQDLLAAAGLEDSDAEDDTVISLSLCVCVSIYICTLLILLHYLVQGMER